MQFDESFWVAVATILFIVFIFKYIKELLDSFFVNRAYTIHKQLDEVVALRAEAEKLLQEQRLLHQNATQEAKKLSDSAAQEIIFLQQNAENNLKEKLALKKAIVTSRIQTNEATFLTKLRMKSLELAIFSSLAILRQKDFVQVNATLLDNALDNVVSQCNNLKHSELN